MSNGWAVDVESVAPEVVVKKRRLALEVGSCGRPSFVPSVVSLE